MPQYRSTCHFVVVLCHFFSYNDDSHLAQNNITTQPEDATLASTVQRVDDSRAPDPDPRVMVTSAAFQKPSGQLLE